MIIAEDFVFLHPPKTGGSFVTEVLMDIYAEQSRRTIVLGEKHGGVDSIPAEQRSKELVTIVRNPFDYYASHYSFGYWIDREEEPWITLWDIEAMRSRFDAYPYLSFAEFIEGALEVGHKHLHACKRELAERLLLGPLTVRMLQFSVPHYVMWLERLTVDDDTGPLKREVARTRFLHTECLNRDTYRWLIELGVPAALAEPVLLKPPVQPLNTPNGTILKRAHGQPRQEHWSELFDESTAAAVFKRDWLFFELFPEYGWVKRWFTSR
jgi:hypothetical protein